MNYPDVFFSDFKRTPQCATLPPFNFFPSLTTYETPM